MAIENTDIEEVSREALWELLMRRHETVCHMAQREVEEYWEKIDKINHGKTKWEERSQLELSCNKDGNSLRLDWRQIKWVGKKANGNRRVLRYTIGKARDSYGYTISKLLKFARDWEVEEVIRMEGRLTVYRKEIKYLVKMIAAARVLNGSEDPNEAMEGADAEFEEIGGELE